ncbi:unnamed protein product [Clonostachys solani]|uniref:Uncharacterized protein n=1 Tax=Clonostachys solani TaxID=160281 RepID=A0A9P0EQQ2_9HYPO|nr:unnamed protein product [Clonostachys solani]
MSLQISCGAGTPDSTSERARQRARNIFDWTYPDSRPHGAPALEKPYRRPEGFLVRLVAIGSVGNYLGGLFFPASAVILLKSIDLELIPWIELHPSEGLSERRWIVKYVTPNFEAQIASGCSFELGKTWSNRDGFLALPRQRAGRSAFDLFRPDSANAFDVMDGRVEVIVHFQVAEGQSSNGRTSVLNRRVERREEEEEESIYDSDGPGSNYQRKRPLARPVQRRLALQPTTSSRRPQRHNVSSSDIDGSSGSSGDESGSSSGSGSGSNSDSGSDDGDDSDSGSDSLSGSGSSEDGSDLSSESESENEARHSPNPRTAKRAPVSNPPRCLPQPIQQIPAKPVKRAPAPRTRPAPAAKDERQPPSSQAVNSRKRPRAEEGTGAVVPASGPGDSTVCIKIEDDAEEDDQAAGPAARTRGAASRRPVEKRTRFSNGC